MELTKLSGRISVAPQITASDVRELALLGFKSIICNRPDGESEHQPTAEMIKAATEANGMEFAYVPAVSGAMTARDAAAMTLALATLPAPVLAYCRSGTRSRRLVEMTERPESVQHETKRYDVVIVGGGSAGVATAASLRKRNSKISIAIIEPSDVHYYQPGWTMVGAGIFDRAFTKHSQASVIPRDVDWIEASVSGFVPEDNYVLLHDGEAVHYEILVACPGIKLDWGAISGLTEAIGRNGVTSNYGYDLAPYTNRLVKQFKGGRALFTQPAMPIKCAGAPQKAMYMSCSRWERAGVLKDVDVQFHSAGSVLFGVAAYVPALMEYVERYGAHLNFESKLVAIDGQKKVATFEQRRDGDVRLVDERYDIIHVVPPQVAPDVVRSSQLAAASGFIEVNEATLQHVRFPNVIALGDACSASNAKTMAAARKQAPVAAVNALAILAGKSPTAVYDGYGSCPLTVEAGKIVLAEFGYGGKLLPSFPNWLIDGTRPSRLSWLLKDTILPPVYWHGMLKGREWMAKPEIMATTTKG